MTARRETPAIEPHLRRAPAPAKTTDSTIAEIVAALSLTGFAWFVWPPLTLLAVAILAGAYAWIRR